MSWCGRSGRLIPGPGPSYRRIPTPACLNQNYLPVQRLIQAKCALSRLPKCNVYPAINMQWLWAPKDYYNQRYQLARLSRAMSRSTFIHHGSMDACSSHFHLIFTHSITQHTLSFSAKPFTTDKLILLHVRLLNGSRSKHARILHRYLHLHLQPIPYAPARHTLLRMSLQHLTARLYATTPSRLSLLDTGHAADISQVYRFPDISAKPLTKCITTPHHPIPEPRPMPTSLSIGIDSKIRHD